MAEEWRPVVGYEGQYEVSSLGRVRGIDRVIPASGKRRALWRNGRPLSQRTRLKSGHLYVQISRRNVDIHTLMAAAFIGPRPDGMEVCHNNGDPTDNRVENLRYDTRSANTYDKVRHGTHPQASKTHCPSGHEYNCENTVRRQRGSCVERHCRACADERNARRRVEYAQAKEMSRG